MDNHSYTEKDSGIQDPTERAENPTTRRPSVPLQVLPFAILAPRGPHTEAPTNNRWGGWGRPILNHHKKLGQYRARAPTRVRAGVIP